MLCIENNRDAISTLDEDEKITVANPDGNPRAGIPHQYVLISESGLYFLVFRSRKPQAHAILQIVYALCQTQAWREKRLLWRITQ